MEQGEKVKKGIKDRLSSVRLRTISLTVSLVIALIFYYLVNVTTKASISWIDFLLICLVQVLAQCIYFPDGEIFGQKDEHFTNNRNSYNKKAESLNKNRYHEKLREFCEYEYEERKKRYVLNECGYIGITPKELEDLKTLSKKEIRKIDKMDVKVKNPETGKDDIKTIRFSHAKRRMLYNLIFKPIPVEKNHPETIMSAVENDGMRAIKDTSITYKKHSYLRKFMFAFLIGGVMAYVAYTVRENFGLAEIVSIVLCVVSLLGTAVTAFTSGEQCSKVYKSRFYLELSNFIDEFNEWNKTPIEKLEE